MKHLSRIVGAFAVVGVLAAGVASVSAHHSTTMFDHSKTLTITGTAWLNYAGSTRTLGLLSIEGTAKDERRGRPARSGRQVDQPGCTLVRAGGWRRDIVKSWREAVTVGLSLLQDVERKGGAPKKSSRFRAVRSTPPTSANRSPGRNDGALNALCQVGIAADDDGAACSPRWRRWTTTWSFAGLRARSVRSPPHRRL